MLSQAKSTVLRVMHNFLYSRAALDFLPLELLFFPPFLFLFFFPPFLFEIHELSPTLDI